MRQIVVRRPQELEGGDRQEQHAARTEVLVDPGQRAGVVLDVLENVEQTDHIERIIQRARNRGLVNLKVGIARATELDRALFHFHRLDIAEGAKHLQIRSGAAAHLEDLQGRIRFEKTPDQPGQDFAPRRPPPMCLSEPGVELVVVRIHDPRSVRL